MRVIFYLLILLTTICLSCGKNYVPKPTGYFRIDLPAHEYSLFSSDCHFSFYYPSFAKIVAISNPNTGPCWYNIELTGYNGQIHLSYKPITDNFDALIEDSRNFAFRHTIKADAINERLFSSPATNVHGILYEIEGNTASSVQFFVTDSVRHFLRGALYFNVKPNQDSLAPMIQHFKTDIIYMIETFAWN